VTFACHTATAAEHARGRTGQRISPIKSIRTRASPPPAPVIVPPAVAAYPLLDCPELLGRTGEFRRKGCLALDTTTVRLHVPGCDAAPTAGLLNPTRQRFTTPRSSSTRSDQVTPAIPALAAPRATPVKAMVRPGLRAAEPRPRGLSLRVRGEERTGADHVDAGRERGGHLGSDAVGAARPGAGWTCGDSAAKARVMFVAWVVGEMATCASARPVVPIGRESVVVVVAVHGDLHR
jgi:hypothetical protein